MFRYQATRTLRHATAGSSRPAALIAHRSLLKSTPVRFASKDTQDKDSLKPTSNEYSKSGSDDAAASSDAAFNPGKTSPEEAEATAEREAGGKDNSLNVSPSNEDVSKGTDSKAGKSSNAPDRKSSGAGSAPKAGKT